MEEPPQTLMGYLLPAVLCIFLALYVTGLAAGGDPELALLRAALAAVLLAIIGRVIHGIADAAHAAPAAVPATDGRGEHLDVAIDDDTALPAQEAA